MESIDALIEENRKMILQDYKLEMHDNISCDWSEEFMSLIHAEAKGLRTQGKTNYYLRYKYFSKHVLIGLKSILVNTIVKTDFFLCRLKFYEQILRPWLKKLYIGIKPQKSVRINRLYRLKDEDFVRELYHIFLNREADDEGFKHNLDLLRNMTCTRLDLIDAFNSSCEGGRIPARIRGKFWIRMKSNRQEQYL